MRTRTFDSELLIRTVETKKVVTMSQLKTVIGTRCRITIFRMLKQCDYLSSYSHRGQYYTLPHVCNFNKSGLWQYRSIFFSKYGNLQQTTKALVDHSQAGFNARELENILQVEVREPLLILFQRKQIRRSKLAGTYIYVSSDKVKQKNQLLARKEHIDVSALGLLPDDVLNSHELKAAMILFFSLLDEQQRRLYAGLESYKLGHGGDQTMATFLDLDEHTVSRGRKELFGGQYHTQGTRRKGGGRQRIEKKHPK